MGIRLYKEVSVNERIAGFFLISVPLLLFACMMPGSIGGGDIKLMAAGGFLLGIVEIWNAFVIGVFVAAAVSMILLFTGKANEKTEIPLGPFLVLGIAWEFLGY